LLFIVVIGGRGSLKKSAKLSQVIHDKAPSQVNYRVRVIHTGRRGLVPEEAGTSAEDFLGTPEAFPGQVRSYGMRVENSDLA
jgi:hypothetical protein